MTRSKLSTLATDQLVQRFADLALEQDEALLMDDIAEVSRLFWQLEAIEDELKRRGEDQRRELARLYEHPNAQVRIKAAKATLAVLPEAARQQLRSIVDAQEYPQAGEAGMSLWNLERGVFKPS